MLGYFFTLFTYLFIPLFMIQFVFFKFTLYDFFKFWFQKFHINDVMNEKSLIQCHLDLEKFLSEGEPHTCHYY